MDKSHRLPLGLQSEDYESLGALCAHYAYIEFVCAGACWSILSIKPSEGLLLTSKIALKQRFELFIAIAEKRKMHCPEIEEIAKEFDRADGLTIRRNDLVHALWGVDNKANSAMPISFTRSGKYKAGKNADAEIIESVTRDIIVQMEKLEKVLRRLGHFPEKISLVS